MPVRRLKRKRPWGYARRSVKRRLNFRAFRRRRRLSRFYRRRRAPRRMFRRAIPPVVFRRHKYNSEYTLGPATTNVVYHLNSVNSMFKPNGSAAGHQPYQFDEMSTLYDYYEVLWTTVRTIVLNTGANTVIYYVGQFVANESDAGPAVTSHDAWKEHPRCNWKLIYPNNNGVDNSYPDHRKYTMWKKIFPKRHLKDKEDNEAPIGQEPATKVYHYTWLVPLTAVATTATIVQNVTFYVKYSRPKINDPAS